MSQKYTYEELPAARSIRLLTLLSRGTEPLHCSLKSVLLEDAPDYTALSYCWGSPEGTIPITCGEEEKTIYITPNLNAFLKQLSISPQEKIPEYLWIDAICINQEDIPERGAQVSIMGKIYRLAEQVTVWLGEGTDESDLAIDWSLGMYHHAKSKILLPDGRPRHSSYSDPDNPLLPYRPDSKWHIWVLLFDRPWFVRAWIFQEAVMARKLEFICGNRCMGWKVLMTMIDLCGYFNSLTVPSQEPGRPVIFWILSRIEAMVAPRTMSESLLSLLLVCRGSECADPRDQVFALLGLANGKGYDASLLQPNYSLDLASVYSKCVISIISEEKSLDVLSAPRQHRDSTLPSWVPDWRNKANHDTLNHREMDNQSESKAAWNASGGSEASYQISENGTMLGLEGLIVDQITDLTCVWQSTSQNWDSMKYLKRMRYFLSLWLQWEAFVKPSRKKRYAPTNDLMIDVFHMILMAGWTEGNEFRLRTSFLKFERGWNPFPRLRGGLPSRLATSTKLVHILAILSLIRRYLFMLMNNPHKWKFRSLDLRTEQRRLIRTEEGFLGMAGAAAEVGDRVAICKGGGAPLILRSRNENWELVSDAYVHGMMNGEAYEEDKCRQIWLV